jgi:hypothetical protein
MMLLEDAAGRIPRGMHTRSIPIIARRYGVDGHSFDEDIVALDFFFHIVLFGVAWWIGGPTLI